jgi:glycosyltransferase involved in cell wall biosynthesis
VKVLYVTLHDPYVLDLASGSDYHYLKAAKENGFEAKVIGPFSFQPVWLEKIAARLYRRTGYRYLKHELTATRLISQATNKAAAEWKPDVIFTIYPSPLVFYRGAAPCVFRTDAPHYGLEQAYPLYGPIALQLEMWQEKRAFRNSAAIITHSEWSRKVLSDVYKVPDNHIEVFPTPAALPAHALPKEVDIPNWKALNVPIRLLLVGRDYRRKGIDIAIDVVHKLNQSGMKAELIVCGSKGQSDEFVKFVGPYKKSIPEELEQYGALFRQAHLLIHPALFDAGAIAPSEAAAFGTPTITNDVGGMGTSVLDGESGIVLPKASPAEAYVEAITNLLSQPGTYFDLCQKTRKRYERELHWESAGKRVGEILRRVVEENPQPEGAK